MKGIKFIVPAIILIGVVVFNHYLSFKKLVKL